MQDGIFRKIDWSSAFDNDSEFIKGFETGIYLRTKGGSSEDYGCQIPDEAENKFSVAIDEIRSTLEIAVS